MEVAHQQPVRLDDANSNVDFLYNLPLHDNQPLIAASASSIVYQPNTDTNFEDRNAFIMTNAKFNEEAIVQSKLNEMLEEGDRHAVMLYTWRCLSRAQPQTQQNQHDKDEVYRKILTVYQPEVQQLRDFYLFHFKAIERFITEVKRMCRKDFVSEAYLWTLGKFINMFAVLDALKNAKASIKNDYAAYRRAMNITKQMNDTVVIQESQNITMFLATHDRITQTLKMKLDAIPSAEDLLADIINACCHMYENRMYILPREKEILLKVMVFGLVLLDSENHSIYKLDDKKRINLARIDKFIKNLQVVPLFGDMQIELDTYIRKIARFEDNSSKWSFAQPNAASGQKSALLDNLIGVRDDHRRFMGELARVQSEQHIYLERASSDDRNASLYQLALTGFQLLSAWTSLVSELYSWKLVHPACKYSNIEISDDVGNYERVTKYNYNNEEKSALIEIIAMIKALQNEMLKMEDTLLTAVKYTMYLELQTFVQIELREPLRQAVKKRKPTIQSILLAVRNCCVDWAKGRPLEDDPCLRGEKDPKNFNNLKIHRKSVGPSSTQLYMVRTMLENIFSERFVKKKDTLRKELDTASLQVIEQFHERSYNWPYLLNYSQTLRDICDLSQLWFREFFLEMSMGAQIQFPSEFSMPWILTSYILESQPETLMEYVLYPFDLYNDSAFYALTKFKKQFLYNEIEAEVNLCFDQLIFKLVNMIFEHYKVTAAVKLLDKKFHARNVQFSDVVLPPAIRFSTIMRQRHVQILGRFIDMTKILAERIMDLFLQSLDTAIQRFECSELSFILELDSCIQINRIAHSMMSEFLPLPDFDYLLREANQNVSSPYGRIAFHVFGEIAEDFLPNFNYNISTFRFIRQCVLQTSENYCRSHMTKMHPIHVFGSANLNQVYSQLFFPYKDFIGSPHLRCVTQILGYQGIALVIEQLLKVMEQKIETTVTDYVKVLINAMPRHCKLHLYSYGSKGITTSYLKELQDVINYQDLTTGVFQEFRIIGNGIALCLELEKNLSLEEITDLLCAGPFQNLLPRPFVKEGERFEEREKRLRAKYANFQAVQVIKKFGDDEETAIASNSDLLTKERLCCGLSMFCTILNRLKRVLNSRLWRGGEPTNGVMNITECSEFHRLWSAFQFFYCRPPLDKSATFEEAFGDSVVFAGCTFICLLSQRKRFEAFDMSYHVLRTHLIDRKEGPTNEFVDIKEFANRISQFKTLNSHIFAIIERYLERNEPSSQTTSEPRCFQPPMLQDYVNSRY